MTYNVFSGTLNPTQSSKQSTMYPNTCFLGPPESTTQIASQSVQPFLHGLWSRVPITLHSILTQYTLDSPFSVSNSVKLHHHLNVNISVYRIGNVMSWRLNIFDDTVWLVGHCSTDWWQTRVQATAGHQEGADVLQAAGGSAEGDWVLSWSDDEPARHRRTTLRPLRSDVSFRQRSAWRLDFMLALIII